MKSKCSVSECSRYEWGAAQTCSPHTEFALISCAIESTDRTRPHACGYRTECFTGKKKENNQ